MRKINPKNLLVVLAAIFFVFSCKPEKKNNELIIFHAGSLSVPFKEMKEKFEKENPGVEIFLESAGSVKCARKITELNKPCDIMASADYKVIDNLLIPEYTNWNIRFAGNEMTIVYHAESKYAAEINAQNWHQILMRDDVIYGRSDPHSDPCGYRAILTTQLAEDYYNIPGLSQKILTKDNEYIRPKEVDLLALLESNTIDYIFLYRSVAQQHELNYLILPDSINLKNPDLAGYYQNASTEITGKEPGTTITVTGEPMIYGITILNDSPNKDLALKFVEFIFSETGAKIMEQNGQPLIKAKSDTYKNIPETLKKFAKQ